MRFREKWPILVARTSYLAKPPNHRIYEYNIESSTLYVFAGNGTESSVRLMDPSLSAASDNPVALLLSTTSFI